MSRDSGPRANGVRPSGGLALGRERAAAMVVDHVSGAPIRASRASRSSIEIANGPKSAMSRYPRMRMTDEALSSADRWSSRRREARCFQPFSSIGNPIDR